MAEIKNKMNKRAEEINKEFQTILDTHLEKIVQGDEENYLEIQDFAALMYIHPTHLSNTIKEITGKAPCDICNEKTIEIAQKLLNDKNLTIASVAFKLTFEPSNFTKYFKKHTGKTPTEYRKEINH